MEAIFSIHLWRDSAHEDYCGCWFVPVGDADAEIVERLAANGFGCFRNEDGSVGRAFFFADEIDAQRAAAADATECYVEVTDCHELRVLPAKEA